MNRRHFLTAALAAPLLARPAFAASHVMEVYKSPTCGCCSAWIDHIRRAGLDAVARDISQEALYGLKARAGITPDHASCHTAILGEYVIEGHVPADDILRLMVERPEALGLAVPGMPIGSPGMEMGSERERFDTLLLARNGSAIVFSTH